MKTIRTDRGRFRFGDGRVIVRVLFLVLVGAMVLLWLSPRLQHASVRLLLRVAPQLARPNSMSCIANLIIIKGAKEQWALENKKTKGDPVDVPGVCEYLKNSCMPQCPQNGVYTLNAVGVPPTCSQGPVLGHTI